MAEADARNGDNGGNAGNEAEPQEHTLQDYLTPIDVAPCGACSPCISHHFLNLELDSIYKLHQLLLFQVPYSLQTRKIEKSKLN